MRRQRRRDPYVLDSVGVSGVESGPIPVPSPVKLPCPNNNNVDDEKSLKKSPKRKIEPKEGENIEANKEPQNVVEKFNGSKEGKSEKVNPVAKPREVHRGSSTNLTKLKLPVEDPPTHQDNDVRTSPLNIKEVGDGGDSVDVYPVKGKSFQS